MRSRSFRIPRFAIRHGVLRIAYCVVRAIINTQYARRITHDISGIPHSSLRIQHFLTALFLAVSPGLLWHQPAWATPQTDSKQLLRSAAADSKQAEKLFSMEFRDVEVRDLLRALGQEAGLNLIVGDEVTGKVTLSFRQVTLQVALDSILQSQNLTYLKKGNVLWVVQAGEKGEMALELRTFPFSYASPKELVKIVESLKSKQGTAIVDERTNTLIVKDLPRNLNRIGKLIQKLDTVTPQVMIEARIVETTKSFAKRLGIQWGGVKYWDPAHGNALPYRFPNTAIVGGGGREEGPFTGGTTGTTTTTVSDSAAARIGDNFAVNLPVANVDPYGVIGLTLGSIANSLILGIKLSAMEDEGTGKILSSPRVMTLNNQEAKISSGMEIPIQSITTLGTTTGGGAAGGGLGTSGITTIEAKLELTVTPQVTSDGQVLMHLKTDQKEPDFSRQVLGIPTILSKSAETNLLVRDGETIVIGGILTHKETKTDRRVPLLSKIPVLGHLFRSKDREDEQNELLIFITPRIYRMPVPGPEGSP